MIVNYKSIGTKVQTIGTKLLCTYLATDRYKKIGTNGPYRGACTFVPIFSGLCLSVEFVPNPSKP